MHGSYAGTIDGRTSDAFQQLTGAPVQYFNHKTVNDGEFWQLLKFSDNQKYIICANSHVDQINCKKGLISSHSYSVIDAFSLDEGIKLLKMRNPWGKGEWQGDWSDNSLKWTDDLKK